jgi:hypothetical protein
MAAAKQAVIVICDAFPFAFSILVSFCCGWVSSHQSTCRSTNTIRKSLTSSLEDVAGHSLVILPHTLVLVRVLAFDRPLMQCGDVHECILVVIALGTKKVHAYEPICVKAWRLCNFGRSSNSMGFKTLAHIVERLNSDGRMGGYVHDLESNDIVHYARWMHILTTSSTVFRILIRSLSETPERSDC